MAVTCVKKGFWNASKELKKWKEALCKIHLVTRENELCKCEFLTIVWHKFPFQEWQQVNKLGRIELAFRQLPVNS